MPLPKIYMSSRFVVDAELEEDWLLRTGCKYRCFSYANLEPAFKGYFNEGIVEAYDVCLAHGIGIMMDSGAHSLHVMQQASQRRGEVHEKKSEIDQEKLQEWMFQNYVKFCRTNKKHWDFFVTLDYKRHQPTIYAMQQKFLGSRLKPMPVYHGDSGVDWLLKHKDMGHKIIALATSKTLRAGYKKRRYFLDTVFNFGEKHGLKFHGLAFTSMSFLTMYPWYSVDSSTWSKWAVYGLIAVPHVDKNIVGTLHVSNRVCGAKSYNTLDKRHKEEIDSWVRGLGFNMKELAESQHERSVLNGYVFSNLEKFGLDFDAQATKRVKWGGLF